MVCFYGAELPIPVDVIPIASVALITAQIEAHGTKHFSRSLHCLLPVSGIWSYYTPTSLILTITNIQCVIYIVNYILADNSRAA